MNLFSLILPIFQSTGEPSQSHPPREFYRQWSAMMLVLVLLGVILITAIAFLIARSRARRRREQLPKPKPGPSVDAWEEAGRRLDDTIIEIKDE